jgi:hypothetical protein
MSKKGYPSTIFEGKEADGAGTEYDVSNVDEISLMITTDDDADFSLAFFGHNKPGAVVDWAGQRGQLTTRSRQYL